MLNQIILVGRLVKTPEVIETKSEKKMSYITLAIPRSFKNADGEYAMNIKLEEEISIHLKPKTVDDFVKVISLAHGTRVWKDNQDELFKDGKINIYNIISNREDVYEYLIQHSIEHNIAIDIVKRMSKARTSKFNVLWQKYVDIMKKHDCDDMFIDILSKVLYIFGRGQVVSECLYAIDKINYYIE